jgi:hypothetical protein
MTDLRGFETYQAGQARLEVLRDKLRKFHDETLKIERACEEANVKLVLQSEQL